MEFFCSVISLAKVEEGEEAGLLCTGESYGGVRGNHSLFVKGRNTLNIYLAEYNMCL